MTGNATPAWRDPRGKREGAIAEPFRWPPHDPDVSFHQDQREALGQLADIAAGGPVPRTVATVMRPRSDPRAVSTPAS
jgi:hypothetical protein